MQVVDLLTFEQRFDEMLQLVAESDQEVVVKLATGQQVILLSAAGYNGWQETLHLLSTAKNQQRLLAAIARGNR